jgi:hypothetical protein
MLIAIKIIIVIKVNINVHNVLFIFSISLNLLWNNNILESTQFFFIFFILEIEFFNKLLFI